MAKEACPPRAKATAKERTDCFESEQLVYGPMPRDPVRPDPFARLQPAVIFENIFAQKTKEIRLFGENILIRIICDSLEAQSMPLLSSSGAKLYISVR